MNENVVDTCSSLRTLISLPCRLIIACATVAAVGGVSTFASSPYVTLQVKVEDGVARYSTDDGKTWSAEAPEGAVRVTDADGKVTVTRGAAPAEGDDGPTDTSGVSSLLIKVEDGVKQYSTDGGRTWSALPPW